MSDSNVAQTIYEQLGGRRFAAMTGAKHFTWDVNDLHFQCPKMKNRATHVVIKLNGLDLYDMSFWKMNRKTFESIKVEGIDNISAEQLQEIFTAKTGLYTRL